MSMEGCRSVCCSAIGVCFVDVVAGSVGFRFVGEGRVSCFLLEEISVTVSLSWMESCVW